MKLTAIVVCVLASLPFVGLTIAAPAPSFELRRFDGGDPVKLTDFAGQILVLDFFAYWCAPCAVSAPNIEEQIQKYYSARSGNAQGTAVRVLSINVEADHRDKTAAFIRKHGLSMVAHDAEGATLDQYGGKGLPYLVIVDGTRGTPGQWEFEIVYRRAGFEGVKKLRTVIDGLGRKEP
jgi:peroxiredoxin